MGAPQCKPRLRRRCRLRLRIRKFPGFLLSGELLYLHLTIFGFGGSDMGISRPRIGLAYKTLRNGTRKQKRAALATLRAERAKQGVECDINAAQQYASRNRLLAEMGFASYVDYLESPLWNDIRKRVMSRDRSRCFGCGGSASQVHHQSYTKRNLAGDSLEKMVAICRPCHELIEFDGTTKVSPVIAARRLDELRAKRDAEYQQRLDAKQRRKQERQKRREQKRNKKRPAPEPKAQLLPSIIQREQQEKTRAANMLEEHRRKLRIMSGDNREFKPYLGSPSRHDDMQKRRKHK